MKNYIIITLLILSLLSLSKSNLYAQNADTAKHFRTPTITDEDPIPPGGNESFRKRLAENIHYPANAIDADISGTVYISVTIDTNGEISKMVIKKDIGYGCGDEALRAIQTMGKWKPGTLNGKPVKVRMRIPVKFVLPVRKEKPFWEKWKKKKRTGTLSK